MAQRLRSLLHRVLESESEVGRDPIPSTWHHRGMPRDVALDRYPGKWVAIDLATDEIVASADSPHDLIVRIREEGLSNVAMMRAPAEGEPIYVGLG